MSIVCLTSHTIGLQVLQEERLDSKVGLTGMQAEVVKSLSELWLVGFASSPAEPPEDKVIGEEQLLCIWQHFGPQQGQVCLQSLGRHLDNVLVELHSQNALRVRLLEDAAASDRVFCCISNKILLPRSYRDSRS